jgi:hypothetical protein
MINAPMHLNLFVGKDHSIGVYDINADLPSRFNLIESLRAATEITHLNSTSQDYIHIVVFLYATSIYTLNFVPDSGIYPIN